MAAATITAAQTELINSLSQDEIPIKLRCAICSRLAVNAFRLPCCEQAICESCQSTLPSSCLVCEHFPVAAADCKPNKSLRTTIKVFLRTEEKKREALRLKDEKNTPPDTPVHVAAVPEVPSQNEEPAAPEETPIVSEVKPEESAPSLEQTEEAPADSANVETTQAQQDVPQPSIEEIAPGQESTADADTNNIHEAKIQNGGEESASKGVTDGSNGDVVSQTPGFGAGFGFDASAGGGFPGMPFGGDFNQMQMMMAMQNGMSPAAFGNFPMMGMPGMSMDPMAMQSMFMNGGFGAGMNGMNMGMGMGGFDGGIGTGFNNGWNGQQSWNVGPDNFNHPNASSMVGNGDYGANNSGYALHAAGYNQGNYGRPNQYNDYQKHYGSQGFRGRGRGRGGYGRGGGYAQGGSNDAFSQQFPQQFGSTQQPNGPTSDSGSVSTGLKADANASNVDEFGREIRHKSETKEDTQSKTTENGDAKQEPDTKNGEDGQQAGVISESVTNGSAPVDNGDVAMPIQTLDDINAAPSAQGYNVNGYGAGRGGYGQGPYAGGRGGFSSMQAPYVKPVDVPINAPTGPKAMREGLPNTSLANLRGRGYPVPSGAIPRPTTSASASVAPEPTEKDLKERDGTRSPSRDRDRSRERSRSKSKERKRSRSRDRHRRHRHQSNSPTEDDQETERRRERRREQRRRREEEEEARGDEVDREKVDEEKVEEIPEGRSRSASPSDSKRSTRRSRRDNGKYRERERDSDREHKSSSHRRRSHRERSRSRDRDDRDCQKDREHRHRSSHSRRHSLDEAERSSKSKVDDAPYEASTETDITSHKPTTNGTNGIEIKGASIRRKSTIDDIKIPTGPRQDRISSSASTRDREKSSRSHGHHREDSHRSSRHESSRSSARDKDRNSNHHQDREKESSKSVPAPPVKDPHEIEREARNRERLLKEAQRIAGLTAGFAGRKRSRDEVDEGIGGGGKIKRKKGRRGGTVIDDENEEARIARLEAEREGARWG